eukprot:6034802-Prymnesium_polylepis.1
MLVPGRPPSGAAARSPRRTALGCRRIPRGPGAPCHDVGSRSVRHRGVPVVCPSPRRRPPLLPRRCPGLTPSGRRIVARSACTYRRGRRRARG